jgi:hypothetical protein
MLQTEFEFTLPRGYVDEDGTLHRAGVMRLATAMDEVDAMREARTRGDDGYVGIALLGRVLLRLGAIAPVDARTVERLFSGDFVFLQELYVRVNDAGGSVVETQCPACATRFALDLAHAGAA